MTSSTKLCANLEIGDLIKHETWPNEYFYDVVVKIHYIKGIPCYFYTARNNNMPYGVKETLRILS